MDKFKKFWAYKVLPLVYDSSLSYLEVLQKLVTKINEVIVTTGELAANVVEALKNSEAALNTANEAENTAQTALDSIPTKTSELTNDSGFVDEEEAADAAPVQSVNGQTGDVNTYHYGICSTTAGTALKVVSIPSVTSIDNGLAIHVFFANALTVSSPRLKLNAFDDYAITVGNANAPQYWWGAGALLELTFQSNMWTITGGGAATTTYYGKTKLSSSTTSTSTTLAATPAAVKEVKDAIPTKVSQLDNDSNFIPKSDVIAWSNITNTDTLAQAQAKLITEPGYLRSWSYGSSANYCPSSNTCVFTAYCKDSNIDYLYFTAIDTVTGDMYIADKAGVWHKIPEASSVLPAQNTTDTITLSGIGPFGFGYASSTTNVRVFIPLPNNANGASIAYSGTITLASTSGTLQITAMSVYQVYRNGVWLTITTSGVTSGTPVVLKGAAGVSLTITWS